MESPAHPSAGQETESDLIRRLAELTEIGDRAFAGEEPRPAARGDPGRREKDHARGRRHALPPCPAQQPDAAPLRDHPQRLARHRDGRHHRHADHLSRRCRCATLENGREQYRRWSPPTQCAEGPHRRHRRCLPSPNRASTSPAPRPSTAQTGYRSQSFLTVPMKDHEDEVIGVLQLINAKDRSRIRESRLQRRRPGTGRVARLAGRHRADQPPAAGADGKPVRVLHQADQQGDRREVALHRRPLRARARTDHDARRSSREHRGRPARRTSR
jgi:hypothetical protein